MDHIEQVSTVMFTDNVYSRLGRRTFWLFLYRKSSATIAFFLLAILVSSVHLFYAVPVTAKPIFGIGGVVLFVMAIVSAIFSLSSAWLSYKSYQFCLTPDAFKLRHGIIVEREIAIPYHQIQNIAIERTFAEQIMGLSRIIISTASHDDLNTPHEDESKGILPALDKHFANALQAELLKRSDVQKVIQAKI